MDKVQKFLRTLDPKRWHKAVAVLRAIQGNNLNSLDIRPLEGQKGHFRCRMGNIRFLFVRINGQNVVYDADFRGNMYKK